MPEKVPSQLPSPHELKYCCFLLCVLFIIVIRVNGDEINYLYLVQGHNKLTCRLIFTLYHHIVKRKAGKL